MAQPTIQTSFAAGELAPKLRSRVDVQKYHSGAAYLRNFFVDYSGGGASTRQGTRFIAQCAAPGARLIPFQPSSSLSYVLEFGQNYIRFYSNGAQILAGGGGPYQIATPYNISDLFPNQATGNPGLKFVQDVTSLIICHKNYPPAILTINSANNWTYNVISFGPTIGAPSPSATTSLSSGVWNYSYIVTAVDNNGQESAPSAPATLSDYTLINNNAGTNTITWAAVPGAVSYNIYKVSPIDGAAIADGAQFGFIGNVTGLTFQESEPGIGPDFSQTPPIPQNPFLGASVLNLTIIANANYTAVPSVVIAPPSSGLQATAYASLGVNAISSISHAAVYNDLTLTNGAASPVGQSITCNNGAIFNIASATQVFGGGVGAWEITGLSIAAPGSITSGSTPPNQLTPVSCSDPNFIGFGSGFGPNVTWNIVALVLIQGGFGYTTVPTVTISGGATATATVSSASGGNPGVPGFLQERLWLAAQTQSIQTVNLSQPGSFFNFDISNPSEDDDAITATIISEDLNDIRWLIPVPTGMIAGTGRGAWLINGGGGISTMNPITPSNITAQPQAFNGANDLKPLKINFDVLYATNKGNYVRDLTYNLYAQIFTGSDVSVLSNHLFFSYNLLDWCWAEEPFKTAWIIRNDGTMLSLGFVKEQDLIGWGHHDTNGQFLSCCSVIETVNNGSVVDAVYVIVQRFINGVYVQYIERMADRYFPYGYEDSWSVDCALQTAPQASYLNTTIVLSVTGNNIIGGVVTGTISAGTRGWVIGDFVRVGGGVIKIAANSNGITFTGQIVRPMTYVNQYTNQLFPTNNWSYWTTVNSVSGLSQLEGQDVYGVADGAVIGPLLVTGGDVALPSPASKITLGLAYLPQLQTLPLDLGEPTVQGKRKKIAAIGLRVADTLGLQIGTSFANAVAMKDFILGNVGTQSNEQITDLVNGDGRTIIDQEWQEAGSYCIQQSLPYPATVLGAMPEVVVGDTVR